MSPERWLRFKEILLGAPAVGVAPGFVINCTLEDDTREVTLANGTVTREVLVDLDDTARLVYAINSERVSHYNGVLQMIAQDGGGTKLIWTIDVLPLEMKAYITRQMNDATRAIKSAFA
jgi:hypothetical protein